MRVRRAQTLVAFRSHLVSKASALFLLTLILLPFTAPFPTYPLDAASGQQHSDGLPKDKIDSDDALTLPAVSTVIPPAAQIVSLRPLHDTTRVDAHHTLHLVLRL